MVERILTIAMDESARAWQQVRDAYRYPVDLSKFAGKSEYPAWFEPNLSAGDRQETIAFEDRFRSLAPQHLEAWFEVLYWKQFSQARTRDHVTRSMIDRCRSWSLGAERLCGWCAEYCQIEDDQAAEWHFDRLRSVFCSTKAIAAVATFPAFLCPDRFPMVDTRVAKWMNVERHRFNDANPGWPPLPSRDSSTKTLQMEDFLFMRAWIRWCRHMANVLSDRTGVPWRARDVEMTVFHAWGDKRGRGKATDTPTIPLPTIR